MKYCLRLLVFIVLFIFYRTVLLFKCFELPVVAKININNQRSFFRKLNVEECELRDNSPPFLGFLSHYNLYRQQFTILFQPTPISHFLFPLIIIEFHQPSPLKAAFLLHFCVFHAVTHRVFAQLLLKRSRNLQGYKFELVNRLWTFSFCNEIGYIITRVYYQQTSVQRYSIEFLVVLHLLHKICLN